jgi:hypothetical protein
MRIRGLSSVSGRYRASGLPVGTALGQRATPPAAGTQYPPRGIDHGAPPTAPAASPPSLDAGVCRIPGSSAHGSCRPTSCHAGAHGCRRCRFGHAERGPGLMAEPPSRSRSETA